MAPGDLIVRVERIEKSILQVRGLKVMLDRDLAGPYGVDTRVLNQAVRRNAERFPADFMSQLTREEIMRISQIGISLFQAIRQPMDPKEAPKKKIGFQLKRNELPTR